MVSIGIDIGSRTIGMVVLEDKKIILTDLQDTGYNPIETAKQMTADATAKVTATGYGRHAARADFANEIITEIKAHALGVNYHFPETRTILDIGGQDTKVIMLDGEGHVTDFQMNDKCSAGTGKFLEVMAGALGYKLMEEFWRDSLLGVPGLNISSMCTVFAESEAISLLHRGLARRDIARALHVSAAEKAIGMLTRIGYEEPVVFTGGVAENGCIVTLLKEKLNNAVLVPYNPQLVGALGAALAGLG
jgi:predicted CoA-substrate-specific enzyme activase